MRIAVLALLALTGTAMAQPAAPPVEDVTVTGTRDRLVVERFVEQFAAPSRLTGKLARWEDGICPAAVGLKPRFLSFITDRVKQIAGDAHAPVSSDPACKPNIEIVFTTTPQALMDNVRRNRSAFLGYHDNAGQADRLARVTHPIQAWYATATRDLRGKTRMDTPAAQGVGEQSAIQGDTGQLEWGAAAVTGSRLGDGLHSVLYHVIIVADPTRLVQDETGALADYIGLVALAQVSIPEGCQSLPSIVNLLIAGCPPVAGLTENDKGYLAGLYQMGPGRTLRVQEDEIAFRMERGR